MVGLAWLLAGAEPVANPVLFELRVREGRSRFVPGETIPLELVFSSRRGRYQLDAAGYDRSGRLHLDTFHLDPQVGAQDPLWEYFAAPRGFVGGGLRSMPLLSETPQVVKLELNEWVRFDRPGTYKLFVTTRRVTDMQTPAPPGGFRAPSPLSSNAIELTIDPPDPAFVARTIADAVRVLDSPPTPGPRAGPDERKRAACRALRFLGSREAVQQMLAYHGGDIGCDFEIQFGLIGAPDRRFVIERMERHIDAPQGHVSDGFLWNLALVVEPPDPPRPHPEFGRFPESGMSNARAEAHRQRMESRFRDYVGRLAGSVARKTGTARAACLKTLLEVSRQPAGGGVPPARAGELREQLATVFSEFPADEQHTLLTQRWSLLKGPAMLPVLRAIVERPAQLSWLGGEDLRTVALRRLHELAPAEAQRILLEEVRRPVPRVGVEALGLLPVAATAGLDGVIVDHLERVGPSMDGMHQLSFLLARYGTRAVLPRAEAYYQGRLNKWMCWEAPFVAYFLRVDPPRGARALEGVLAERRGKPHPDCFKSVLGETARLHYAQELETIAVAHLDDPDPEVAVDAARVLGKRGSAAAEQPLWRRLAIWHAQWKDRAMELTKGSDHARRLEEALREGLALSPAWIAGRQELDRLASLAVTPNARSWVESHARSREQDGRLVLSFWAGLDGSQDFTVAQYRLSSLDAAKAKLAQFPRGAAFVWRHDASVFDPAEEIRASGELEPFMRARGLSLAGAPRGRPYGNQ